MKRIKNLRLYVGLAVSAILLVVIGLNYSLFIEDGIFNYANFGKIFALWLGIFLLGVWPNGEYKLKWIVNLISLIILAIVVCVNIEYLYGNAVVFNAKMIINILLCVLVYVFFIACGFFYKTAVVLATMVLMLLGVANHYLLMFRNTPLLPWDIAAIGTAREVASAYNLDLTYEMLLAILSVMLVLMLALRIKKIKTDFIVRGIICSVLFTVVYFGVAHFYNNDFLQKYDLKTNFWNQQVGYAENGVLPSFVLNVKYTFVSKPDLYSLKAVEEIKDEYLNNNVQMYNANGEAKKPHIIAIMNESYADLSALGDLKTNRGYMDYFNSLDNVIRGKMYSSVYGGTTCNSEFEFLTGNSMYNLKGVAMPYQQAINEPKLSIVDVLKEQGYTTVAMHPAAASNWNRDKVYPYLGFDEFLDVDYFEDLYLMRGYYASDESDYDNLIRRFEERKDDEPMFIFNVTIQNHGSYALGAEDIKNWVLVEGLEGNYPQTCQYLSCMLESDKALKHLLDYFKSVDEPVILCFFGDHQPAIESGLIEELMGKKQSEFNLEETMKLYEVPFIIWANYDLDDEYIEATSANYLGNMLLDYAGVEVNGYNEFLSDIRKQIPAITSLGYMGNDGKWYSENSADYDKVLNDYQKVQYNMFSDKDKVKEFADLIN